MSHIKIKLFSIFTFILVSLYLHFVIGDYFSNIHQKTVRTNINSIEHFIKKSIEVLINEKKTFYIKKSNIIFSDEEILESLKNKNRIKFYKLIKKHFDDIKKLDYNFWGLHLILPDNMSFIRVHKPEVKDELIKKGKKELIDYVNENKKIITSFDAGKFGYFLRVVTPIFSKQKDYLGLAEFSINVDSLGEHIKNMFGYEVQFLVKNIKNKDFLNRLPKNKENLVVFRTTNPELFEIFNIKNEEGLAFNIIKSNNKFYKTIRIKLSPTANIQTSFDITNIFESHLTFKNQLEVLLILINIFFLILWYLLTKYYIGIKKSTSLINLLKVHQEKVEKQKNELDRLNHRFELVLDAIKDGIWDWNLEKDKVYYSKEWEYMIGYNEGEFKSDAKSFFDIVHPEDKEKLELNLQKHFDDPSKNKYNIEARIKCKDGKYKWVLARGICILNNEKKPIRMLGSNTDISERKNYEEFIKRSNSILEMIAVGESASKVYNEIALLYESRHSGMRCSLLELHDGKLIHGAAPSLPKEYNEALNGLKYGSNVGSCGTSTYRGTRVIVENIETDPKWAEIKQFALPHGLKSCWSEPIINSTGEVLGAFGMYYNYASLPNVEESEDLISAARLSGIVMQRDQSEQRIYQDQLLISEQSKLAAMGEMIGNIAHQWRQPLSLISTISTAIAFKEKMSSSKNEQLLKDMNMINENSQYLSRTIDDFRDFIKDNKEIKKSSIKETLLYTIKLLEASIQNNYIQLILDIEDDIEIIANKNELVQCFINIINNAKDALKENTKEENRIISIRTKKVDYNSLELCIFDNGGGINDNILNRIFEPYFTTKHQTIGTGIGLSMVNKILKEKYKAKIIVYNGTYIYDEKSYFGANFKIVFKK